MVSEVTALNRDTSPIKITLRATDIPDPDVGKLRVVNVIIEDEAKEDGYNIYLPLPDAVGLQSALGNEIREIRSRGV